MRIDVLTLFPEIFGPFFAHGIVGRAANAGVVQLFCTNFRDFATDRHRTVDDRPFGGGPGMVLMCGPVFAALESLESDGAGPCEKVILSPQGEPLCQKLVNELSNVPRLALLCGHYEGFDDRITKGLNAREVSVGDYILSGGEPAAMVLIDAIVRLVPGALGEAQSLEEESFTDARLEYPHYTRPRSFRGMEVPEVLLSGNHEKIAAWRREQSWSRTAERRPDLLTKSEVRRPSSPAKR